MKTVITHGNIIISATDITLGNIIIATTDITTDKDTSKTLNYTKAVGSRLHGSKLFKVF